MAIFKVSKKGALLTDAWRSEACWLTLWYSKI